MIWAQNELGLYVPVELPQKQKQLHAVDLFAGCGGFSLGVETAGIDVVAAVEWDAEAALTYLYNLGYRNGCAVTYGSEDIAEKFQRRLKKMAKENPMWGDGRWVGANRPNSDGDKGCRAFHMGDASKLSGQEIIDLLALKGWKGKIDFVCGGPPCQGMSMANAKSGPTDPRNNLILEFLRLTNELDADMFVMENVPPLLEHKKYAALRESYFKKAGELGYDLVANVVNAVNYGVPQYRRRAIIMGHRPHIQTPRFPMPTHWATCIKSGEVVRDFLGIETLNLEMEAETEQKTEVTEPQQMGLF